jgi:hypothetical protein
MSTSLKVVSIAAVFCASFSRRAMVWRSRVLQDGRRSGHRRRLGRRALDGGEHVALGHASVLARSRNGGGIDTGFGSDPAYRRRRRYIARGFGGGGLRSFFFRLLLFRAGVAGLRLLGLLIGLGGRRRAGAFLDRAEQRANRDRIAVLDRNIGEHTRRRCRHLDGDFVGFQFDQRLVDGDHIARLLEPFADRGFRYRLAEGGYTNLRHDRPAFSPPSS